MEIYAMKPGMLKSAEELSSRTDEFQQAIENAKAAREELMANWEGDAKICFQNEQEEYTRELEEMVKMARTFSQKIIDAVEAYSKTDSECARLLRNA